MPVPFDHQGEVWFFLDTPEQSHPGMVQNSWDKYIVFKGMAIFQSETIMIMAKAGLYGYGPIG